MKVFRVWLSPLGNNCRLRVDGLGNAQWLLNHLGHSFIFKTAQPLDEEAGSSFCSFRVAYDARTPQRGLEKLLAAIPEVQLMIEPA